MNSLLRFASFRLPSLAFFAVICLICSASVVSAQPGGKSKPSTQPKPTWQEAPTREKPTVKGAEAHANIEQRGLEIFVDSLRFLAPLNGLIFAMRDSVTSTRASYAQVAACFLDKSFDDMVTLERMGKLERELTSPLKLYVPSGLARQLPLVPQPNHRMVKPYAAISQKGGNKVVVLMLLDTVTEDATIVAMTLTPNGDLVRWCTTERR